MRQQRLKRLRPQNLRRMRIERDRDRRTAERSRLTNGFGDERLVPAMHAVEVADGDGAALAFARNGLPRA